MANFNGKVRYQFFDAEGRAFILCVPCILALIFWISILVIAFFLNLSVFFQYQTTILQLKLVQVSINMPQCKCSIGCIQWLVFFTSFLKEHVLFQLLFDSFLTKMYQLYCKSIEHFCKSNNCYISLHGNFINTISIFLLKNVVYFFSFFLFYLQIVYVIPKNQFIVTASKDFKQLQFVSQQFVQQINLFTIFLKHNMSG
eukprot:TRINITY_DN7698_c0_g1_i5.p1 TRINITY_DN7698_c0_g1~~TRINITY_DN7698_c0_g1_i5.p1  ORF type:complete len:199 (-),score=-16.71 TRINITY_DN7698_c0_g1_i5:222-818(-)